MKLINTALALVAAWSIYKYAGDLFPQQTQSIPSPPVEARFGGLSSGGHEAATPAKQRATIGGDLGVGAKPSKTELPVLSEDWGVLVSRALQGGSIRDKQTAFQLVGYCAQINDTREYIESVRGKSVESAKAVAEKVRGVEADMRRCQSLTSTQLSSRALLAKDLLSAGAVGSSTLYLTAVGSKVESDLVPQVAQQLRVDVASGDFEALLSVAMFGRHFGYTAAESMAHYLAAMELKSYDVNNSLNHEAAWRGAFDTKRIGDVDQLVGQITREFVAGASQRGQK
jgi:hypothetical protein